MLILKLGRVLVSCIKMSQMRQFEPHYLHTHMRNDVYAELCPRSTPLLMVLCNGHLNFITWLLLDAPCITWCSCCTSGPRTLPTTGPSLLDAHHWEFTKFHDGVGCFQHRHQLQLSSAVNQSAVSGTTVRPTNLSKSQPRGWKGSNGITHAISSLP